MIIVGGNINYVSCVMMIIIVLETLCGNLVLVMVLGVVFLLIVLVVNAVFSVMAQATGRGYV